MNNNEIKNVNELNTEELEAVNGGKSGSGRRVKAVSGDTYVRKHPDRDAAEFGVLYQGDSAPYLEEKRWDDRVVVWYKVSFHGHNGWVSSRYTKIVG
ncbi:MAG: SH3 domain-containing protein [Clostridia bacterium]|nr:SH3 domain-containing protein [Clostridia bacterium]